MKSGKVILGIVLAAGLYYLLKKSKEKKQPVVLPAPVNTTNAITPSMAAPTNEQVIITPMEQVSDLANGITNCTANRINVRYIAGKTHYI